MQMQTAAAGAFFSRAEELYGSLVPAMRSDLTRAFELLRSGNSAHLEQALELLQNTVFSFSMTVCGHREDAEDTMQEVLLKAIPYLSRFDSPKALTTWLYTVARNRCWMSRRRSKFAPREHLSLDDLMPDAMELDHLGEIAAAGPSPERSVIAGQDSKQLQQAILRVPPPYRLVLVLHDVEELATDEIAQVLNLKEGNVRVRLHRARLFVRKEISQLAMRPALQDGAARESSASPPKAKREPACSRRCKQIFANLSDYLNGALDDTLCRELERHMGGCKPCEAFLASLRTTIEQTQCLPSQQPEPHAAARVRARLAQLLPTIGTKYQ
jgi:RNA polymerase sigma-70 factor (ECF subfamily)